MTDVSREEYPLGVSRPPLGVDDLPEPEEVFKVPRLGVLQIVRFVVGPSLIALGISIGSGEWLLGPQAVGTFGFVGVVWVITISAILQTFYNVEVSRYVVATGEVPVVGWGRVPPGWMVWIPFSLLVFYFAFIFGGWAAAAGQGLFALIVGRVHEPDEIQSVRWLAIGLLFIVFLIAVLARKISRALELTNWVLIGTLLIVLLIVNLAIVPFSTWWEGIRGLLTPAAAAVRHHRHPTRRPGGLHRARLRPQLVRHGALPRQGVRHGSSGRLHRRPARRPQGGAPGRGHLPRHPAEHLALAPLVPAAADRPVGGVLRRP